MIQKVEQMTAQPVACLACGGNPVKDGKAQEAIDLGVDVNFGDSTYLCIECVSVICDLAGRAKEEVVTDLRKDLQKSERQNSILRKKLKSNNSKLNTVRKASKIIGVGA